MNKHFFALSKEPKNKRFFGFLKSGKRGVIFIFEKFEEAQSEMVRLLDKTSLSLRIDTVYISDQEIPKEICICAAIKYDDKVWRGQRHSHCIRSATDQLSYKMSRQEICKANIDRDQGFITSTGRYVDRDEGLKLQIAAHIKSVRGEYQNQLYSEDLY